MDGAHSHRLCRRNGNGGRLDEVLSPWPAELRGGKGERQGLLSPSNARTDVGPKLTAYHHAGVPYYWIVDTEHETLIVYRATIEGYVVALTAGRDDVVRAEPFDAIELRVRDLFGGS